MHIPKGDYAPPEHVTALTREAEPILAELGISTNTAYRLLLDRVAQVLAWLRAAAVHNAWFRSKVEARSGLNCALKALLENKA